MLTEAYIQQAIVDGLRQLFGEAGASIPISIDKLAIADFGARFIVRCPAFCYVKVRSSITLQKRYNFRDCAFHVLRLGANLLELSDARIELSIN